MARLFGSRVRGSKVLRPRHARGGKRMDRETPKDSMNFSWVCRPAEHRGPGLPFLAAKTATHTLLVKGPVPLRRIAMGTSGLLSNVPRIYCKNGGNVACVTPSRSTRLYDVSKLLPGKSAIQLEAERRLQSNGKQYRKQSGELLRSRLSNPIEALSFSAPIPHPLTPFLFSPNNCPAGVSRSAQGLRHPSARAAL